MNAGRTAATTPTSFPDAAEDKPAEPPIDCRDDALATDPATVRGYNRRARLGTIASNATESFRCPILRVKAEIVLWGVVAGDTRAARPTDVISDTPAFSLA